VDKGYSSYFASSKSDEAKWGATGVGIGHEFIAPGAAYPPGRHPVDHMFSWNQGRVLQNFQIVYISSGRGEFESVAVGCREVVAGTLILLFPGVWHRYRPDPGTGWTEDWIEVKGASIDRLLRAGEISVDAPLHSIGHQPQILSIYEQGLALARVAPPEFTPFLGMLGMQILAQLGMIRALPKRENEDIDASIQLAKELIGSRMNQPLVVEKIAEEVGIPYSLFRRMFRLRTGLTPKQYHLEIRLRKAQDLLANTHLPIKGISDALGYHTAFHLSADFKARTGLSPSEWRLQSSQKANRPEGI
jgi:AraC-like DNA-binding protein